MAKTVTKNNASNGVESNGVVSGVAVLGNNVQLRVKDDKLLIVMDMAMPGKLSESGKSEIVASVPNFSRLDNVLGEDFYGWKLSIMLIRDLRAGGKGGKGKSVEGGVSAGEGEALARVATLESQLAKLMGLLEGKL